VSTTTTSTISLSSLGSGIDWQSIVNELKTADEASITPYNNQITTDQSMISAWSSLSGLLSTLDTATETMDSSSALDLYSTTMTSSSSTAASSLLSASASSTASVGSYSIVINGTAQAEKIATSSFSSESSALGISGTILVNGQSVSISSTDTLLDIEQNINDLDTGTSASGVTASILQSSSTSFKLVLTSNSTGASGISLANGSSTDTLTSLGFNGSGTSIKNATSDGAESDAFTSKSTAVEALLGNSDEDLSGTVTINGKSVTIDLSDSLSAIQSALSSAGISASIVSSTSGSATSYRLAIEGMTSWTDSNNVLQALGLVTGGAVANTTTSDDTTSAITSSTLISAIKGYNYTSGDEITISGTTHDGTAVTSSKFAITDSTTVGDLLSEIDNVFGNVTASVNSSGQLQIADNDSGTSKLSVNLTSDISSGTLSFGSLGEYGTTHDYVLQQGADASFSVDGVNITSSTNTNTTAIEGVTLNLLGADSSTTLTLNINHDVSGIENEVNTMVSAYNSVMSFINTQMSYNTSTSTTGGALFGDNTLVSIKEQLQSTILEQVGTGTFQYLSQIGISQAGNAQISFNTSQFESVLSNNFQDVADLFADSAYTSNSEFQYGYSTADTQSGTYTLSYNSDTSTAQIDGYDASVNGDVITLDNSASKANGLQVVYNGTTSACATITVNRGIASLLDNLIQGFTNSTNGTVTTQTNGLNSDISQLNSQIDSIQTNINMQIANLTTEYENMNTYVAQMDALQSYLTTQFSSL